jgi:CheY-like chemotaxis protein
MTKAMRIVIVEDNGLIAMDLADVLIAMGHYVCAIARTEAEAVTAAARYDPNLMIVDGHLEEGSGVAAMRQILTRGFVPHLYVTGDPFPLEGLAGDAIVVTKPFNLDRLARAIAKARHVGRKATGTAIDLR